MIKKKELFKTVDKWFNEFVYADDDHRVSFFVIAEEKHKDIEYCGSFYGSVLNTALALASVAKKEKDFKKVLAMALAMLSTMEYFDSIDEYAKSLLKKGNNETQVQN